MLTHSKLKSQTEVFV